MGSNNNEDTSNFSGAHETFAEIIQQVWKSSLQIKSQRHFTIHFFHTFVVLKKLRGTHTSNFGKQIVYLPRRVSWAAGETGSLKLGDRPFTAVFGDGDVTLALGESEENFRPASSIIKCSWLKHSKNIMVQFKATLMTDCFSIIHTFLRMKYSSASNKALTQLYFLRENCLFGDYKNNKMPSSYNSMATRMTLVTHQSESKQDTCFVQIPFSNLKWFG